MRHRCAVCWKYMAGHDEWRAHAEDVHGASLADFGYARCLPQGQCPGAQHARKLPLEGNPAPPRRKPVSAEVTARDGTTYRTAPLFPPGSDAA